MVSYDILFKLISNILANFILLLEYFYQRILIKFCVLWFLIALYLCSIFILFELFHLYVFLIYLSFMFKVLIIDYDYKLKVLCKWGQGNIIWFE